MNDLKKIVCAEDLRTSLSVVKSWSDKNIEDVSSSIEELKSLAGNACECELVSEKDYGDMVLRLFGGEEDLPVPELSSVSSWYGGSLEYYPNFEKQGSLLVFLKVSGNDSMVVDSGVIAYNGEDAKTASVDTVTSKGIKFPNLGKWNALNADVDSDYCAIEGDLGYGVAYAPYATIKMMDSEVTVYGDEVRYVDINKIEDLVYNIDYSIRLNRPLIPQRNVVEFTRVDLEFQHTFVDDEHYSLINTIHNMNHPILCLHIVAQDAHSYRSDHKQPMDSPIIFLGEYDTSIDDSTYYIQFGWASLNGSEVIIPEWRAPKHRLTWQVALGYSIKDSTYGLGLDIDMDDINGRAFLGKEWVDFDYNIVSNKQVTVKKTIKQKESSADYFVFYISDSVEDPYALFQTGYNEWFNSNAVKTVEGSVLQRNSGEGLWIGVVAAFDVIDLLNLRESNGSERIDGYLTTRLVHIPASAFDSH